MRSIVCNSVVSIILDTGATVSLIRRNLQEKLGVSLIKERSVIYSFHSQSDCSGFILIPVTIGLITAKIKLYVSSELEHDLILGLDNISKFYLSIKPDYQVVQELEFEGRKIQHEIQLVEHPSQQEINSITSCHTRKDVGELLSKYSAVFATHKYDVGSIGIESCRINLKSDIPMSLRPYRCSEKDQKILEEQINLLLKHQLIRRSNSPYSFPITLVSKKTEGEKARLCIDFRQLNKIAIADNFPFPRIEDIKDKLFG